MQLGFVSAILPDLSLEEVVQFTAAEGFQCLELMCWPRGKAERRYAGVTHVDVGDLGPAQAQELRQLVQSAGVAISGLGYYPNPLAADRAEAQVYIEHLKRVILAAELLGVGVVNTFVGRDPCKSLVENWPRFLEVWPPLVHFAEEHGVRIGIENCPMFFTADEWPGGKNLAHCAGRLAADVQRDPQRQLRLELRSFAPRLAADGLRAADRGIRAAVVPYPPEGCPVDRQRLDDVGILATPLEYHTPKSRGEGKSIGQSSWPRLKTAGYDGPVCIEVEDRDFEGSLDARKQALRESGAFLRKCLDALGPASQ